MYATTTNGQFGDVSFQLDQLVKVLGDKDEAKLAVSLAQDAASTARLLDSILAPELEDRLVMQLQLVLDEVKKLPPGDVCLVTMVQKTLAAAFRALKRFCDAEAYDRMNPSISLLTVATLAADIFSQNNPTRKEEVIALYRQSIELGYASLTSSGSATVRAEIGGIYIALARVFIAFGAADKAEAEIEALIALNDKAVAEININNGLPFSLIDAYKLLVRLAMNECAQGNNGSSSRTLNIALAVATRVLNQDCGDLKTRMYLIKLMSGTTEQTAN